ncbi:MAG TPA: amino acid permease [Candidatus Sulfotelmatobacter sp.]|nr:amino acid permease [Candidatus Sulfotelmatobacter sp.]
MPDQVSLSDEGINQSFGYKQELRRALKLFSLYAVAFSIISITTGLFANYGFGLAHLGAAMIWLWPVAAIGQLLVALVVAELGTRIPLAGYSYQWGARLVNTTYGWFTGFVGLCYLSVGAAAINFVVLAPIIATVLKLDASNPTVNLVITVVIFAAVLTINIISIALASKINNAAVVTEIVGMVGFALILFVLWAIKPNHSITFLGDTGGVHGGDIVAALPYAALMGIFTIVGFELAADLGEEAVAARVTVPKAVIYSVVSSAVLGMVALIGFTIAIPDLHKIAASSVPLADIVTYWMGDAGTAVFLLLVIFSIFALDVIGLAATGRLIFSFSRDNILPFSAQLRKVNPRTQTPIRSLATASSLGLLFVAWGYLSAVTGKGQSAFLLLVTATATLPFIVYFLTVLAYVLRRPRMEKLPQAFDLGAWARPVMYAALAWTVIALGALMIPKDFWSADWIVVIVLAVAAAWYFAVLRGRLARGEAGVTTLPS